MWRHLRQPRNDGDLDHIRDLFTREASPSPPAVTTISTKPLPIWHASRAFLHAEARTRTISTTSSDEDRLVHEGAQTESEPATSVESSMFPFGADANT